MWLRQGFRFGRQGFNKGMREHDRTGCEQRLYCRGLHSWGALRACAQSGVQEKDHERLQLHHARHRRDHAVEGRLVASCRAFPAVRNGARRADPLRVLGDEGGLQGGGPVQAERQSQRRQVRNAVRDGVPRSVRRGDGSLLRQRPWDHRFHARRADRRMFPPAYQGRARPVYGHAHFRQHRQRGGRAGRSAVRHPACLALRGHDAHAVHHADHVRGFLRVRRHHHARRGAAPDGAGAGPHPQHVARPVLRHAAVRIVETDHGDGGSRRRTALRKRGGVRTVCFPRPSSVFPRRP